jgi:hypothetical protein
LAIGERGKLSRAVNRAAAKCLDEEESRSFNPTTCKVREIYLPIEELAKAERYHKRLKPQREDGPIILLNVGGKTVVIDGNNRINKWERKGKSELTRTIIMEAL